jgi:transcriptional regulator with XRE-family HTH domain
MNENRGFGKFLAELRIKKGFEMQKDLSDKSGVSTATISRLEAGKQKPLPDVLNKLAPVLGVSSAELLKAAGYIEQVSEESAEYKTELEEKWPEMTELMRKILNSRGEEEKKEILNYAKYIYNRIEDKNRG